MRRGRRAWRRKRGGYDSRSASIAAAAPRRRVTRLARFAAWFQSRGQPDARGGPRASGRYPPSWSVGRAGVVAHAEPPARGLREGSRRSRLGTRAGSAAAGSTPQLRAQDVRVRLRRPRRHAEPLGDLDVRATLSDQLDDLSLTRCEPDVFAESEHRRPCLSPSAGAALLAARAIFRAYALRRMKDASWPRAFTAPRSASDRAADAQKQLELVAQVRPHHLGPVRGDREGDAAVGERPDRVAERVLVGERAREQVRGGADLEDGAGLARARA